MDAQLIETTLIDKISGILEDLKSCLNQMSIEEVKDLEKCINSLFQFHKIYLEAKNHLVTIYDPENDKKKNEVIEKLRQEHALFSKESNQGS